MSGKYSRDKGKRAEYQVRDALRKAGYEADRVPLSGASQGYKGDIRARKCGREYTFEVKSRASGFTSVYQLFAEAAVGGVLRLALGEGTGAPLCRITDHPDSAVEDPGYYAHVGADGGLATGPGRPRELGERMRRKLLNMQKWLGTCDVLVIKEDRAPVLYIRYI